MKIFESVPIKNIQKQIKLCLKDEVEYREGQVVSKTLAQNRNVSLTLFAFEKGEEISRGRKHCYAEKCSACRVR